MGFSHDWTEPSRNDATGKWEQAAVVCSWIHRPLFNKGNHVFHKPHINLRILRTHFSLEMMHSVAGCPIKIVLSQVLWTSGIFRHAAFPPGSNLPVPSHFSQQQARAAQISGADVGRVGGALLSFEPPPPYILN